MLQRATVLCSARLSPLVGISLVVLALGGLGCDSGESTTSAATPTTWTRFRGPDGSGAAGDAVLPERWTADRGIRWRTLLPDGIAQPIVVGDRIFVTAATAVDGPAARVVLALDRSSGEVLWQTEIFTERKEKLHYKFSSMAMATPAADAATIYAYFGPVLAALDHDGQLRWRQTIDPDYWQQSRYGAVSSPILEGEQVIIFRDKEDGDEEHAKFGWKSWLATYSRDDGSLVWKTEWDGTCCSYATPNVVTVDGRRQILVTTTEAIKGFDLETGAELWSTYYPSVQVVPSSNVAGDLFIASGAVHNRVTAAYRLMAGTDATADAATPLQELWTTSQRVPEIATPVIHGGVLHQVTGAGVATALDAETGETLVRRRLPRGPYRASLLVGGGKVYALAARGTISVWRTEPPFELLGTFPLPDDTGPYLSMAPAPDCLLVRARQALYCVEGVAESLPAS